MVPQDDVLVFKTKVALPDELKVKYKLAATEEQYWLHDVYLNHFATTS